MGVTTCVRCDNETCKEQLHFAPMAYASEWHLPDAWLSVAQGDTHFPSTLHFCSLLCLRVWTGEQLPGQAEEGKCPLVGDWQRLNGKQNANVKTLEQCIITSAIGHIEDFYKQHPELQIGWDFQIAPYFRNER